MYELILIEKNTCFFILSLYINLFHDPSITLSTLFMYVLILNVHKNNIQRVRYFFFSIYELNYLKMINKIQKQKLNPNRDQLRSKLFYFEVLKNDMDMIQNSNEKITGECVMECVTRF